MSVEDRVRAQVAPLIWRTNPSSVALASIALKLAGLADAGRDVADPLARTLSHLADCSPEPGDLVDEVRVDYCRHLLALHSSSP